MAQDSALQQRLAQVLAPGYAVEAEIGRGGMGIVYRAKDTRLKRTVAIKLLPPELAYRDEIRSRFLREAEMAAQLSHPNIVPIYSVDEKDGFVYFIMAYVDGETLAQRLTTRGRLGIVEARTLLRQVADALAYAHARGVIHRDIKPDNIMLSRDDGHAMVTDFGIARAADDTTGTRLTATGIAIGTPAYMSPEQCTGDRSVDGRSDLYSLGVVIYAALVGTPPFAGSNTAALLVKHLTETPRSIREVRQDVPDDLVAIINRLLQKNPADRFQDAASVIKALDFPDSIASAPKAAPSPAPRPALPPAPAPPPAYSIPIQDFSSKKIKLSDRTDAEGLQLRVRRFRRSVVSWLGLNAVFVFINVMSGMHGWGDVWFPWVTIWPAFGIFGGAGKLWADGVSPWTALVGGPITVNNRALGSGEMMASRLVPPDVLNGPYGPVMRRATGDHAAILEHYAKLKAAMKKGGMVVSDPTPAANQLVEQIADLAKALHRIDVETPESQRPQLAARRVEMSGQLDRASLALQNLALDLLKMRSTGVDTMTSATEQARALSDDISYAISAADELRANK